MKTTPLRNKVRFSRGLTLLELTVVIAVTLSLIAILFIGARGWKRGSDRATCLMNIRQIQQAVRNYSAVHQYFPGEDVSGVVSGGSLYSQLVGTGKYLEKMPVCPDKGLYHDSGNLIPPIGELYMSCSLASTSVAHVPDDYTDW